MITVKELKQWVESLDPESDVAIDAGGLILTNLNSKTSDNNEAYLEVGGIPLPEDEETESDR